MHTMDADTGLHNPSGGWVSGALDELVRAAGFGEGGCLLLSIPIQYNPYEI